MEAYVYLLAAAFFRALGVICLLPLGAGISGFTRHFALAAGTALLICEPGAAASTHNTGLLPLLFEFCVGFLLGLPAALALDCARVWGQLADNGRGQSLGEMYDPISNLQTSCLGSLTQHFAFVTLLCAGILEELLSALFQSTEKLPLGHLTLNAFLESGEIALALTAAAAAGVFSAYLIFAGMYFVVDCVILCISKAVPGASFLTESFQLKSYLLFLVLLILSDSDAAAWLLPMARPRLELLG